VIVGLGIDLVDVSRVERLIARHADRALRRLFTPGEIEYARARVRPALHYAVRLAAKEAAYKALAGNELARGIGWRELEVVAREGSSPSIELHGVALARVEQLGARTVHLSLSHTDTAAAAVVVIEGPDTGPK
jgi:holo-[acyl-carrier protein] synthase